MIVLRRDCRDDEERGFIRTKREVPPFGGTCLSNSTDAERELAALAGVLLTGVLLLLAGLLLPAALLLAGLLTWILVRLARILILIAHSEFSLCFIPSTGQPGRTEMVAGGTAVPVVILRGDCVS
jgi:hypothetical protein